MRAATVRSFGTAARLTIGRTTLIVIGIAMTATSTAVAFEPAKKPLPKWELGAGFGYLSFEHYPASDQHTQLMLPFPTFQYRGSTFRADDREKARLYVLKRPSWHLQLGGFGLPPLASSTNLARQGMEDLPLFGAVGPQLHKTLLANRTNAQVDGQLNDELTLKAALYQGFATNLAFLRPAGLVWEIDLSYRRDIELWGHLTSSTVSIAVQGASQEVHDLYFGVPAEDTTPGRPSFEAHAGFLQSQLSWFQSFKRGDFALYAGLRLSDHRWSASRESPLHKTDQNWIGLVGITHDLYRSQQTGVAEEAASGVVDKLREKRR